LIEPFIEPAGDVDTGDIDDDGDGCRKLDALAAAADAAAAAAVDASVAAAGGKAA
jgi:hypothetical protein